MKSRAEPGKAAKNQKTATARRSSRTPSQEDITSRIAIAAYYKAEARGFAPGYMLEDWLAAEKEIK